MFEKILHKNVFCIEIMFCLFIKANINEFAKHNYSITISIEPLKSSQIMCEINQIIIILAAQKQSYS